MMDMLVLGLQLENFLEGYARITMSFAELISTLRRFDNVVLVNVNRYDIPLLKIVKEINPKLSMKILQAFDIRHYPYLSTALGMLIAKIINVDVTLIDGRLWVTLLLNLRGKNIVVIYSRNYFTEVLRHVKGEDRLKNVVILNPYINYEHGPIKSVKTYPPLHEIFFQLGCKAVKERPYNEEVIFRIMGRLHPSRGYREAVIAFKRFKIANPSVKARLVIDSFSEDAFTNKVKIIRPCSDVDVAMWNPLLGVRSGLISPVDILNEVAKKYAQSSYVLLPYVRSQFIEPPLTLLEALAAGSFVVVSDLISPFVDSNVVYKVRRDNIVKDLIKAFEYLYEIYDSNYYWSVRQKAYEYALKNCSYDAVREKVLGVLNEILE
jgi:glycosyltransferase involved in cell wall biosynthesis